MSDNTNFLLILAVWGAGLGAAGQYAKVSVIFDQLSDIYPEAGVALGFVVSVVGFVGILLGVVAGLAVARIRYRRALLWALWAGAALSALQATTPPLPVMLALRGLEGVSHLAIVVAAPTLIAQLSAERHRGLTLTLWSNFFSVAFSLLVILGLPLVEWRGIPALFLAHACWMGLFALVLARMLPRGPADQPSDPVRLRNFAASHAKIYASPFVAAPALGWLFYTFGFLALLTILPPFIPEAARATTQFFMPLAAIAVSMTLGVWLLRHVTAIQVIQLGFATSILCLLWLGLAPGAPLACLALAGGLGLVQGATFAAVPQLNATANTQALAYGGLAQMGNLGNTIGTPLLLLVLTHLGFNGMVGAAALVFGLGIVLHLYLSKRRAAATSRLS